MKVQKSWHKCFFFFFFNQLFESNYGRNTSKCKNTFFLWPIVLGGSEQQRWLVEMIYSQVKHQSAPISQRPWQLLSLKEMHSQRREVSNLSAPLLTFVPLARHRPGFRRKLGRVRLAEIKRYTFFFFLYRRFLVNFFLLTRSSFILGPSGVSSAADKNRDVGLIGWRPFPLPLANNLFEWLRSSNI